MPAAASTSSREGFVAMHRIAILAVAGFALAALPATAQQRRAPAADSQNSMVEQLNQESLNRARAGLNSPTPGPDTTQNLNRMSEDAARSGRNMNQAPMPFR
jgi:hypothetical protein